MLESIIDRKALGSLIFARIVYAINWLNVGAIFYLMSPDLGEGISGLGTLTSAFYLGIGIMQVPGGILAAKWGPKKVVVIGVFLSSLSVLATSAFSSVNEIAVLRFLVGWGMAFVFAPGVVMVARLLQGGRSGMGVGLFNSTFDIGGVVGLFGWIIVAGITGWRLSLAISGLLGVVTGILTFLFVPEDGDSAVSKVSRSALSGILRDRKLILTGLGMLGIDVGNNIISVFMVLYLVSINVVSGTIAGLITSLVTVVPIFAALWGGRVYDTIAKHRMAMVLTVVGSAVSLAIASYPSIYAAAVCTALGGLTSGVGYTLAFAGARDLNPSGKGYEGLAIAWVNSIHLTGSFLPPVFFAFVVGTGGYPQAWLWSAALSLVFLVPIMLMPRNWSAKAGSQ